MSFFIQKKIIHMFDHTRHNFNCLKDVFIALYLLIRNGSELKLKKNNRGIKILSNTKLNLSENSYTGGKPNS